MPRKPQLPGRARTIATRSRARRLVAVAAASLLTMLVTAAGAHAQGGAWQSLDSNGDGYYDAKAQDSDGNGNFDNAWFDLDKDGWWDTQMFNSRYSDALLEILNFDMDENGEVEIQMRDGDQRVGFDYVLFDRDQDGDLGHLAGQRAPHHPALEPRLHDAVEPAQREQPPDARLPHADRHVAAGPVGADALLISRCQARVRQPAGRCLGGPGSAPSPAAAAVLGISNHEPFDPQPHQACRVPAGSGPRLIGLLL